MVSSISSAQSSLVLQMINQAHCHLPYAVHYSFDLCGAFCELNLFGQNILSVKLSYRAQRNIQKLDEFFIGISGGAFGYVTGD
jgi:hypothetical protein